MYMGLFRYFAFAISQILVRLFAVREGFEYRPNGNKKHGKENYIFAVVI